MTKNAPVERREFPRVQAYTKINVVLRHRNRYLIAKVGNISAGGLYVTSGDPLDVGSIVDFEFTLLDEVRPYVGRAEVVRLDCTNGGKRLNCQMGLKFLEIKSKPFNILGLTRQAAYLNEVTLDIALSAMRYAWAELQGNRTDREFGAPGAGFRRPVLLVHGWLGTRGAMLLLEHRLKRDGFPVFSVDLGIPNVKDIRLSARQVCEKVERLNKRLGLEKIDILAHSMGGLISLWGLKHLELAQYVHRLVTIGTPFHGTLLAGVALPVFGLWGRSLWQMLPNSPLIKALHEGPLPADVPIHCLAARNDKLAPVNSATLDGAHNILVERGHASLVTSESVYKRIRSVLEGKDPFSEG